MRLLSLTVKSIANRRLTASLCILCIAVSVALLVLINLVRQGARQSFFGTISGVDLIVGPRTGSTNLLLYSVFRMGAATNNISWQSYKEISNRPEIAWTIPISLGDSHRGFRVIGTNSTYYEKLQYRGSNTLSFSEGQMPHGIFEAILGSDVAEELGYHLGQKITLTHGVSTGGFGEHADKPFVVSGILKKTGTPVDRSIHVPLEGISAIHVDWKNGAPPKDGEEVSLADLEKIDLTPKSITAFFVGTKSKMTAFRLQRDINEYSSEALMAILPGVALTDLWQIVSTVESALIFITMLVVIAGIIGLCTSLLSTLNERRREMAILRALGASPYAIAFLFITEAALLTFFGIALGTAGAYLGVFLARPFVEIKFGLTIPLLPLSINDIKILIIILFSGVIAGVIPAGLAYKRSLSDGLVVRT